MAVKPARLLALAALVTVAACATYKDNMPSWMPGSSAVSVKLTGGEEVPPVTAAGTGSGSFRVAEDGTVSGSVKTENVAGTMAHIHTGAKGQNGPVTIPLTKEGDTYTVPAGRKLTADQMNAWKEGRMYVNVHTNQNKGGEVRGQITP